MAIYRRKQVIYLRKKKSGDLPQKMGFDKKKMGFNENLQGNPYEHDTAVGFYAHGLVMTGHF